MISSNNELSESMEEPLVVLMPNRFVFSIAIFFIVLITIFALFYVVLPVVSSGTFMSVWPEDYDNITRKTIVFFLSSVWLFFIPSVLPTLNNGKLFFYRDYLLVKPFLKKRKIIVHYEDIRVKIFGKNRVLITDIDIPTWNRPLMRVGKKYFKSIAFGMSPRGWKNPENIQDALRILQDKAHSVEIKHPLL